MIADKERFLYGTLLEVTTVNSCPLIPVAASQFLDGRYSIFMRAITCLFEEIDEFIR